VTAASSRLGAGGEFERGSACGGGERS